MTVDTNACTGTVAQKGHVHYPIQYFPLPISTFLITNFQFGYFSFPISSFLITNFQYPISNFLIFIDNCFNLGRYSAGIVNYHSIDRHAHMESKRGWRGMR